MKCMSNRMTEPKRLGIALIVPAHNEERHIGACIESVLKSAPGRFDEILVVDNASTDTTAEVASKYPGVRVIRTERKGLTHARQVGLEATKSELIAYIDADCRMDAQWLPAVMSHFSQHPHTVSLTGPVWYYDGPSLKRWIVIALQWMTLPLAYLTSGYLVIGGNFVARRDALERIGGFDTNIAFYGEDADIARRLSEVGPVYLRMHFAIATSMRRFMHEGILRTCVRYALNFLSHRALRRSLTISYTDVRT